MTQLFHRWQALWQPDRYHGWGRRRNYFEGWYIKLVSPCERYALAFIPGIAMDADGAQHAFVQRLDGKACQSAYHRFEAEAFRPAKDRFAVKVGENNFSGQGIHLRLPEATGELAFEQPTPWPNSWGAPGIMGWYSFVPFMECYHGVVSLHHRLRGELQLYGETVDFTGGIGYMEKDWGRSFPSSWIWMQSNHLSGVEQASLMVSVARIPWLGNHFPGFLAGLLLDGQLYRFTTYNGAKSTVAIDEAKREVQLHFKRKGQSLRIRARQEGGSGELAAPVAGAMAGKVNESLQSTFSLQLTENSKLRYEGEGRNTGLELAGPVRAELEG